MDDGRMSLMPPPHLVVVYLSMCAVCMHACMHVCADVFMYVRVDIHVCIHVYVYVLSQRVVLLLF